MSAPTRPSLFGNAPHEVFQDAFLAWLIEWSDPSRSQLDGPLHRCGLNLLRRLFTAAVPSVDLPTRIERVEVARQRHRIDLLVVVDGALALIIEDKVHAGEGPRQVERYREALAGEHRFGPGPAPAVYVKSGGQGEARSLQTRGIGFFGRRGLIDVLEEGLRDGVDNDIHADFLEHLQRLEAAFGAWRVVSPDLWGPLDRLWEGWFETLGERLPTARWHYVPNANGGQWVMWLAGRTLPDGTHLYTQVDSHKRLRVRLWTASQDGAGRRRVRNAWGHRLREAASDAGLALHPPDRSGNGATMAIASFAPGWLRPGDDGGVDTSHAVACIGALDDFVGVFAVSAGE